MRFRQNAARALLLPRLRPGKRTPLWLQRLRARDLLALARSYRSFPIVAETYREVMDDRLPLRELRKFLSAVEVGKARFAVRRGKRPSPFSSSLLFDFTAQYLYEWDEPKPLPAGSRVDRGAVSALLGKDVSSHLLDQAAIAAMEERLQGRGEFERARDGTELVELLRRIGDLTREELSARTAPEALAALPDLLDDGRVAQVELPDLVAERPGSLLGRIGAATHVSMRRICASLSAGTSPHTPCSPARRSSPAIPFPRRCSTVSLTRWIWCA